MKYLSVCKTKEERIYALRKMESLGGRGSEYVIDVDPGDTIVYYFSNDYTQIKWSSYSYYLREYKDRSDYIKLSNNQTLKDLLEIL